MSGWGLSGIGRMVCLERMRILTVCLQRCFEEDGLKARWVFPMGLQHHSQSVRRDFGGEVGILRHSVTPPSWKSLVRSVVGPMLQS